MGWLWWVGAALVFAILEMLVFDMVLIMFTGGALAAALAYVLGAPAWLQVIVFAVVSAVLLVALRPFLLHRLRERTPLVETNSQALVGREAVALSTVTLEGGRVKIGGEVWTARAADEAAIPPGAPVRVARIDGATAVVALSQEV
jgi:membrane protein implicated in regulation of membrane protease activity